MKRLLCIGMILLGTAASFAADGGAGPEGPGWEKTRSGILHHASLPLAIATPPRPEPVPPRVVFHGDRTRNRVALTFDACATRAPSGCDEALIRVLTDTRTPATLFLGGKWMLDHPEATRRLAQTAFFELGNHSFLHPHMTRLSDQEVRRELEWTQIVLFSLTGRVAAYYRPPYGEQDERTAAIAAESGLVTVQFDLASGDPDPAVTPERLVRYVTGGARGGSIVVMHMNGRGWKTAEVLPAILSGLHQKGFELVTVGELLGAGSE
ncbi:MAG: polysaccharide deacetylase family protein [Desulfobacterales bacterium]